LIFQNVSILCKFEKYFRDYLERKGILHFFNYSKHPQLNAKIERANRTLKEEFLDYNLSDLFYELMDWLIFPTLKGLIIPPLKYLIENLGFFTMLWTYPTN
jgi:transposase InsO family protein